MGKKLIDVIKLARAKGLKVSAKITSEDGWQRVRIKTITDKAGRTLRFTGSKGNTALRIMMKEQESALAVKSRQKSAYKYAGGARTKATGAPKLSKEEQNAIRRLNRLLKKRELSERASRSNYRKRKAREGAEGVRSAVNNSILHYSGYAYPANVKGAEMKFRLKGLVKSAGILNDILTPDGDSYAGDYGILDEKLYEAIELSYDDEHFKSIQADTFEEKINILDGEVAAILEQGIEKMNTTKKL